MAYSDLLKDPRWQKKRLLIFQRDDFKCRLCNSPDHTLNVHHLYYLTGKKPWEYPDEALHTLCNGCHEFEEVLKQYDKEFFRAIGLFGFTRLGLMLNICDGKQDALIALTKLIDG